jgi:type IV pilus assembly protein PilA
MTNVLKSRKGVTLVELLAVVVILGIIAAIAVPTIGGLISRQQTNADKATYTQIVEAAKLYAVDDTDGIFTVEDLETDDFIDLKSNTVGMTAGEDEKNLIYIKVVDGVVTFHSDAAATTLTAVFVNDTEVAKAS